MKYSYYRFGVYRESKGAFQKWFRHFVKLGIPCCIVKSHEGFSLWRYGQESVRKCLQPNSTPIRGRIVIRSVDWPEEAAYVPVWVKRVWRMMPRHSETGCGKVFFGCRE